MNSTLKYFWNIFVFFIFVYYFKKLLNETQKVIKTSYIKNTTEIPSILFCVSLDKNCKIKKFEKENFKMSNYKKETMENLVCHLNQNIPKNPKLIIEEAEKWNFLDAFNSKNTNFVKKNIILFDYHLCANYDLILDKKQNHHSFKFFFHKINVKVFLYSSGNINSFYGLELFSFYFNKNDQNISSLLINQIEIYDNKYIDSCLVNKKKELIGSCSKVYCYQNCFKIKTENYRFLFSKKDDFNLEMDTKSTDLVDNECFIKCFENFKGVIYYIISKNYSYTETKSVEFIFQPEYIRVIPSFLKSPELLILEIASLLGILLGFSYLDFSIKCLTELVNIFKFKQNVVVKKAKIFIIFLTTTSLMFDCYNMIYVYRKFLLITSTASMLPFHHYNFSVSPCFDVKKIFDARHSRNQTELFDHIEENSLFTLEKNTLKFENILNNSFYKIIKTTRKAYIDKKEVKTFFISKLKPNSSKFNVYKCFFIRHNSKPNKIKSLIKGFHLKFEFKEFMDFYFINYGNSYPNSETNKLYLKTKFRVLETSLEGDKKILRCKNYKSSCKSQVECIDKCILSNYSRKFFKLPSNIPIFLNWYSIKDKKILVFDLKNTLLNEKVKKFCLNLFPLADCYQKVFNSYKIPSKYPTKKISIFSNHFTITKSEVAVLNTQELFYKILTSINIWIGLNISDLFKKIIFKINKKTNFHSQLPSMKNIFLLKTFRIFFNLLIFFGLIYSLYTLCDEMLKQNKIVVERYKFLTKLKYPYLTICIDYKYKLNSTESLKLNGFLLDKMTFSANDIFESVSYYDNNLKKHTQKDLNKLEIEKDNDFLDLSHFYFLRYKCYKLKYHLKISFNQFFRNQINFNYLVINFKPNLTEYFFTLESIKTPNFNYFKKLSKQKNIVYFVKIKINFKDSYTFLKDFNYFFKKNSIDFNHAESYFNFLKKKFKESENLTTLFLPLDKKYFELTINDQKFLKFYRTRISKLEKENIKKSYSAEYFLKITSSFNQTMENKLKLKPKLIAVETLIEDKIPVENFFLAVLNIISFWYNLSLIEIFNYFLISIKFLFFLFYSIIFKIFAKICLIKNLFVLN